MAMWIFGADVVSRALPSFSTITTAPESATRKFAPLMPMSAARNFSRKHGARHHGLLLDHGLARHVQSALEQVGHLVAGHVQRRRHDVIRPFVRQLQNVLAEVGLHRFQVVMLQPFVEVHFLGGHGFRFHDELRAALFRQCEHKVGNFGAVLAIHHLASARRHVALEFFEVMVEIVDGVLLDRVGLGAQFLVFRQGVGRYRVDALFFQPSGSGVNRQLEIGVRQGVVDLAIEFDRSI